MLPGRWALSFLYTHGKGTNLRFLLYGFISACILFSGCTGAKLTRYNLVSPVERAEPVYEDRNMKVSMKVVDDRMIGLTIFNKTAAALRIYWINSSMVVSAGTDGRFVYKIGGSERINSSASVTSILPGCSEFAEIYPMCNVYRGTKGEELVYPLYYNGSGVGRYQDIEGRSIGINLVVEVDEHQRMYPFMIKAYH